MTETEARAVLLMHAFDVAPGPQADDAAWASREARRQLGERAAPVDWLVRRAELALDRRAQREPGLRPALAAARRPAKPTAALACLAAALLAGILGESLGSSRHVNLLALPLMGLLLWNLAVYLWLAGQVVRRLQAPPMPADGGLAARLAGAWQRWRNGMPRHGGTGQAGPSSGQAALARFAADWLQLSAPLQAARATAWLHAGAALLATGAVLSLYARGLVFDYQAGWDSTFLQPAQVRQALGWLLGPASALSGLALPDAAALAGLRLSAGGGEGAGPWIHRWAITLVLSVVLPRAGLAGWAWHQAREMAHQMPLPDEHSLRALMPADAGVAAELRPVAVLPYSYRLDADRQGALAPALAAWLGPGLQCQVRPTLPLGAEDNLPQWLPGALARLPHAVVDAPAPPASLLVLLFALTATPERDSHGALVRALSQALASTPAPRPQLRVAVDESGYRQRLAGPDGAQRLAERRAAWESLLMGLGVVPGFVDLSKAGAPP